MGLTIHYTLQSEQVSLDSIRQRVGKLHARARDLPFTDVGPIVELDGEACTLDRQKPSDPLRWLVCQSGAWLEVGPAHYKVPPTHLVAFTTWPGPGCEPANFGLCRYPAIFQIREATKGQRAKRVPTHLKGWQWTSFCKTQYASNPKCGGAKNFLKCHLGVITLLDYAQELGMVREVVDEGDYWTRRDVAELVREVGLWNQQIAGFMGRLKDLVGNQLLAEITQFPNFEHLEAQGRAVA